MQYRFDISYSDSNLYANGCVDVCVYFVIVMYIVYALSLLWSNPCIWKAHNIDLNNVFNDGLIISAGYDSTHS